ncbi:MULTISPECIES: Abi family protein [Enterobacteriaceae]|nr:MULTISPECIES: Abi family protein [Enterobacteriaceae]EBS0892359.1 CAAX protease [Salmonella enterica subsp. enterica serovar Abaetetuba]EBV7097772.1 CAAX protease [Salmonella enterica subsp. enterica serovar Havana]EDU9484243.1 Abi family protein [Salmonella enterica subsp. arizonae]EEF7979874.1 Abi family protein [Salmonella enterica subsp. arizonae serovar 40:z4,z32:-]EJR4404681.1 Abi family protein [Salmonella enterica]ELK6459990.1 Abi family protein [Enterobacter ludwigii]HBS6181807.1
MNYHYIELKKLLSAPRIGTYENFFVDHTEEEIYGVYIWNKVLCGAIYPLLQAVEITIRNTINNAAVSKFGPYWHELIDHVPHFSGSDDYNYTNLKSNFEEARKNWLRKENKRRLSAGLVKLPNNHKPDFNCVVAETDFSTWEFALHSCFYKLSPPTGSKFLWPLLLTSVFENWPYQSSQDTRNAVFGLVSELRPFRNRLSHHEPLWKGVGITNEVEALNFINKKIDSVEKLLQIISTDKIEFIRSKKIISKAKSLATKEALDIFRNRAKSVNLTLRRKTKLKKFISSLNEISGPKIVTISGRKLIIDLA